MTKSRQTSGKNARKAPPSWILVTKRRLHQLRFPNHKIYLLSKTYSHYSTHKRSSAQIPAMDAPLSYAGSLLITAWSTMLLLVKWMVWFRYGPIRNFMLDSWAANGMSTMLREARSNKKAPESFKDRLLEISLDQRQR